jgi:hypothetical protein
MEMSIDEVQSMCLALCYEHQINTGATSLPEPVYQADEWAKRGQSNFIHFRSVAPSFYPLFWFSFPWFYN